MALSGGRLRVRAASRAKSIIMMAFFLTIPHKSSTPISAITLNSMPQAIRASKAPPPADGRVERMVSGWMRLSYSMPSTIYRAARAASTSTTWLPAVSLNILAVP